MYCTNCGKQIDYDSPVCVECARAAESRKNGGWQNGAQNGAYRQSSGGNTYESYYSFEPISPDIFEAGQHTASATGGPQPQPAADNGGGYRLGLGRAIVAAVLAQLAAIFLSVFVEEKAAVLLTAMMLTSLPCAIVALCLGIASIRCFRDARRKGLGLPIATRILGIHAVANAGAALLLCQSFLALL